jgi:hypothetical protein
MPNVRPTPPAVSSLTQRIRVTRVRLGAGVCEQCSSSLVHARTYVCYGDVMDTTYSPLHALGDALNAALGSASGETPGQAPVVMSNDLVAAISTWDSVMLSLPWLESLTPQQALYAIGEVDRLRRRVDAAIVVLSKALGAGRDTVAALSRATHMSNSEARQYARVARQRETVPEIVDRLADGDLSLEHATALAALDAETARTLIDHATTERVDDFRARVKAAQIAKAGDGRRERQQAERSVRFTTTPEGSVKATIVLPEADGTEFRNTLDQLCDIAYKQDHPNRASTVGGHNVAPREQRLADAFIAWMRNKLAGPGQPAVVVVVDADTLDCTRLPNDPVSKEETATLLQRAKLYALIRDKTTRETIQFGRNRRLATPLQKLLLTVRYGYCSVEGCYEPAQRCDADHIIPFARGGLTNDTDMQPLCHKHHQDKTDHENTVSDKHSRICCPAPGG